MDRATELNILNQISWSLIYFGGTIAVTFPLFDLKGHYGRYANEAPKRAPRFNAKWSWFLQELPAFLIPLVTLRLEHHVDSLAYIAVAMLIVHYFNRSIVYTLLMRNPPPYAFYVTGMAFCFSACNGFLQSRYMLRFSSDMEMTPVKMLGLLICILGLAGNIFYDYKLIVLRSEADTDYKIPYGGLFDYVSCPNFLAECLEWAGFALFTGAFPAAAFAIFTLLNLGVTANSHHRFYLDKFEEYPKDRKRMIPFVY